MINPFSINFFIPFSNKHFNFPSTYQPESVLIASFIYWGPTLSSSFQDPTHLTTKSKSAHSIVEPKLTYLTAGRKPIYFIPMRCSRPSANKNPATKISSLLHFNPLPPSDAIRKQKKKHILEDLFSSVLSVWKISPLWKPEILIFRHYPKLKIAYFNRKNPFNLSYAKFHSKYFGRLWIKEKCNFTRCQPP